MAITIKTVAITRTYSKSTGDTVNVAEFENQFDALVAEHNLTLQDIVALNAVDIATAATLATAVSNIATYRADSARKLMRIKTVTDPTCYLTEDEIGEYELVLCTDFAAQIIVLPAASSVAAGSHIWITKMCSAFSAYGDLLIQGLRLADPSPGSIVTQTKVFEMGSSVHVANVTISGIQYWIAIGLVDGTLITA